MWSSQASGLKMAKTKEWSQKFREEIVALHKQGKGYKRIAQLLNVPRDTVGSIVRKYKPRLLWLLNMVEVCVIREL